MKLQEAIQTWENNRQQGSSTHKFDFEPQTGENYCEFTKRSAFPGREISKEYNSPDEIAYVYWAGEDSYAYVHWNRYWLVALKDGRYAFFSSLSSGTCSYCSSASDDVAFASSLEEIITYGMGKDERRMAGVELEDD